MDNRRPYDPRMTEDELFDTLTHLEETTPPDQKPARFEAAAAELEVGEHGRASLLVAAGEHWQMRGEHDAARRCFAEALADGGDTGAHPVASLVSLALEEGDDGAVAHHLQQMRELVKSDAVSSATCLHIGESLEEHGRLRDAHRWFTMPLTWVEDDDDLDFYCLMGRLRVREALGLPQDRFDAIALEERTARRQGSDLT